MINVSATSIHPDPDSPASPPMPSPMGSIPHRTSLLDVLRHIASHRDLSSPPDVREIAMRRDLSHLVSTIDPENPASLAEVRLRILRRVLLAEWGEAALGDYPSLVMLRAADRLVAVDPEMRDLLRRAVVMLKRSA
ncbi:MAG TPA: hypothetical protein VGV14_08615 [Rhodanobacter sp.]|nr:hypothetical protein [Rhodanobacter sp.]